MNSLTISAPVRDAVKRDCLDRAPLEACGFIVGIRGSSAGTRMVPMRNVHPTPDRNYEMDPKEILAAYGDFDERGEDPLAVYHSHVNGPAIPSSGRPDADVESAQDLTLAYVIVSLDGGLGPDPAWEPTARAFRIRQTFIGMREFSSIPLMVTSDGTPWAPTIPSLPWCLTPGNRVRLKYLANGKETALREIAQAEVMGSESASDDPSDLYVLLDPTAKAAPKRLLVERIREVKVLRESMRAETMRADVVRASRHLISAVDGGEDLSGVQNLVTALSAAFPPWLNAIPNR